MLKTTRKTLGSFIKSTRGTVALVTALITPAMIIAAGFSLDYGLAINADRELKSAADTAALGALNEARIAFLNEENVDLEELVKKKTEEIFLARANKFKFLDISSVKVEPSVVNNVFNNQVTYKAKYKTQLMKYSGFDKVDVSGVSRATVTTTSYININILFDISSSMGIAATQEDERLMANTPGVGCAFGCHIGTNPNTTSYTIARNAGATMRIDVSRNAAMSAVRQVENVVSVDDQVTFGIKTFHNRVDDILDPSDPRSSDFDFVASRIQNAVNITSDGGGTKVKTALSELADEIPPSGTGLTPDSRIQYVIVLTDGIEDERFFYRTGGDTVDTSQRRNNPYFENVYGMEANSCEGLQQKNAEIYFIYTEYLSATYGTVSPYVRSIFDFIERDLKDDLPRRFTTCTGDAKRVVKTSSSAEIQEAFSEIIGGITSPLRLY